MADCRIRNEAVRAAAQNLSSYATEYSNAGTNFENAFKNALSPMEGEAKDAMLELFESKYKEFLTSLEAGAPAIVKGMSDLLEANRKNFEDVDGQIAASIRDGGN